MSFITHLLVSLKSECSIANALESYTRWRPLNSIYCDALKTAGLTSGGAVHLRIVAIAFDMRADAILRYTVDQWNVKFIPNCFKKV